MPCLKLSTIAVVAENLSYVKYKMPISACRPCKIWCNEAQERYVIAIKPEALELFAAFCEREHCLYAVIGQGDRAGTFAT